MPAADELFRTTGKGRSEHPVVRAVPDDPSVAAPPGPSGRVRHDEKMTVYVTSSELLRLEQARLLLRGGHGIAVDRGRLVREALALVLDEFEAVGEDSALLRKLREG
jgi:hypothetical protein